METKIYEINDEWKEFIEDMEVMRENIIRNKVKDNSKQLTL